MPDPWIASHLPGRLRLRHSTLRLASRNDSLQTTLRGWDGVLSVTGNPATGGVLVHYDPARIPPAEMEARLAIIVGATPRPSPAAETVGETNGRTEGKAPSPATLWRMNRAAKIGMLGSLSGTLLALAVGKKLHAAFGVAHLAFLAVHLTAHRKKLLR